MSFVRKGAAVAADPGTRPGLHSQTLVSSGHADLDRLLGGGLPLGSLTLLLEDGWSGHAATLLRYFLAEGAACGQSLLLAAAPPPAGGLPKFLPAQLKAGRAVDKEEEEGKEGDEAGLRIAWQYRRYLKSGGPAGGPPGGPAAAGQLAGSRGGAASSSSSSRGSVGSSSSSSGGGGAPRRPVGLRDWCHQFDLLRGLGEEGLQQCRAELADCSSSSSSGSSDAGSGAPGGSTQQLVSAAATFVRSLAPPEQQQQGQQQQPPPPAAAGARAPPASAQPPPRGPRHVGRIAVLSLGSLGWQLGEPEQQQQQPAGGSASGGDGGAGTAVLRALLQLKALVREARCAAVASVPAALLSPSDAARLHHLADCVVSLESVADDSDIVRLAPDAASVVGLLHLRKLPALGTLAPPAPEVALHLVRHRRRRLAISPVEIDPDAEAADAEAASSAGKSVAAVLCGGPPKAASPIDF